MGPLKTHRIHLATVDGDNLTQSLRLMDGTSGRNLGAAFWRLGEVVEITWSGVECAVEGEVHYPLDHDIAVPVDLMRRAVKRLEFDGPTDIFWEPGYLCIGVHRIRATKAPRSRPFFLGVDATDRHLLRAVLGRSREAAVQSGFGQEMEMLEGWLRRSIEEAAATLSWMGITEERLSELVVGALTADAKEHRRASETTQEEHEDSCSEEDHHAPRWSFLSGREHIDLISSRRTALIYLYRWRDLGRMGMEGADLQKDLFLGLVELSEQYRRLRERAFTVFVGDYGNDLGGYAIAITVEDEQVAGFLRRHLPLDGLHGPREGDISMLVPLFRYDHGHLIRYVEDELAGTTYIDYGDWLGTGRTVYRRGYCSTESKSQYGELFKV